LNPSTAGQDYVNVQGSIRTTGNITAFYSDERLKDIEGPITGALEKVNFITGVRYKMNDLGKSFGLSNFGFTDNEVGISAQELRKVLPEAVKLAPFDTAPGAYVSLSGEEYLTIDYERITPLLVEAVKELSQQVDELREEVKRLKENK